MDNDNLWIPAILPAIVAGGILIINLIAAIAG